MDRRVFLKKMAALGAVGIPCADDFVYASDTNDEWLSIDDLRVVLGAKVPGAKVEAPLAS